MDMSLETKTSKYADFISNMVLLLIFALVSLPIKGFFSCLDKYSYIDIVIVFLWFEFVFWFVGKQVGKFRKRG